MKIIVWFILFMMSAQAHVASKETLFYRSFWYPLYHGERLAYCSKTGDQCGAAIARAYCQELGFSDVKKEQIAFNVGRTHYWAGQGECTGWKCHGFLLVECAGHTNKQWVQSERARKKKFVYPRIQTDRVAWCLTEGQGCGEKAAYSFCRRMGYSQALSYAMDTHVYATRALGDRSLCYGAECSGFETIVCYR